MNSREEILEAARIARQARVAIFGELFLAELHDAVELRDQRGGSSRSD